MDLNNLSKHQLILAALLVSFVASIATGIVTVSLLNQAPAPVTDTIERVVQTTVEKAVPSSNGAAVATTKETIVVKDDDAVVGALGAVSNSVVRIYGYTADGMRRFVGLGVIATTTSGRTFVIGNVLTADQSSFQGIIIGEANVMLQKVLTDPATNLSLFAIAQNADPAEQKTYVGADFGESNTLALGESVVALGGETAPFVSTGIVSSLITASELSTNSPVTNIETNISDPTLASNALLLDLSGDVIGFKSGTTVADGFIPSDAAVQILNQEP